MAKAAWEYLTPFPQQRDVRIVSYVLSGSKPAHQFGKILNSRLTSWDPGDGDLFAPEPIQRADVVIVVRGFDGSFRAAHWAETIRKPVLPVAYFGGAAKKIYDNLSANFERNFGGRLSKADFEDLNAWGQNWPSLAARVVSLAEKAATSKTVIVLMSYSKDPGVETKLKNAFFQFQNVCKEFSYNCQRVDETNVRDRILPKILEQIERAAFVIADLTELKQNVFFELGFAEGLKKPRIVTAQESTSLPFDVKDFPVTYWDPQDMKKLHDDLRERMLAIAEEQGHAVSSLGA